MRSVQLISNKKKLERCTFSNTSKGNQEISVQLIYNPGKIKLQKFTLSNALNIKPDVRKKRETDTLQSSKLGELTDP